ncbi:MAG: hypothetical protein FWG33_03210, partial [Oscillospiraceae bacterium]|nr:hypothetical protein [Oscillospiraceae bacterium]
APPSVYCSVCKKRISPGDDECSCPVVNCTTATNPTSPTPCGGIISPPHKVTCTCIPPAQIINVDGTSAGSNAAVQVRIRVTNNTSTPMPGGWRVHLVTNPNATITSSPNAVFTHSTSSTGTAGRITANSSSTNPGDGAASWWFSGRISGTAPGDRSEIVVRTTTNAGFIIPANGWIEFDVPLRAVAGLSTVASDWQITFIPA